MGLFEKAQATLAAAKASARERREELEAKQESERLRLEEELKARIDQAEAEVRVEDPVRKQAEAQAELGLKADQLHGRRILALLDLADKHLAEHRRVFTNEAQEHLKSSLGCKGFEEALRHVPDPRKVRA